MQCVDMCRPDYNHNYAVKKEKIRSNGVRCASCGEMSKQLQQKCGEMLCGRNNDPIQHALTTWCEPSKVHHKIYTYSSKLAAMIGKAASLRMRVALWCGLDTKGCDSSSATKSRHPILCSQAKPSWCWGKGMGSWSPNGHQMLRTN